MKSNPFGFGSCRVRAMLCPQCLTILHSVPQILYFLDVIEGIKPEPPGEWLQWVAHDKAENETWYYDLYSPTCFIVEISSLKTVWAGPYPVHLSEPWKKARYEGKPPQLTVATGNELYHELGVLYSRLDRPLILFGQVCFRREIEARQLVRNVIAQWVQDHPGCRSFDPTTIVDEIGEEAALVDVNHLTPRGMELEWEAIKKLIV